MVSKHKIQAHRGFSEIYPENTLLSFQEAVHAGADGIEMDIRRTADGVFVVIHDHFISIKANIKKD